MEIGYLGHLAANAKRHNANPEKVSTPVENASACESKSGSKAPFYGATRVQRSGDSENANVSPAPGASNPA
jgi:hypothetical protein